MILQSLQTTISRFQHRASVDNSTLSARRRHSRRTVGARRGFNLLELLIALAISAALLTATMVALDASVTAYQSTTESASTQTIARLTMNRMMAMIRNGRNFGPYPVDPEDSIVQSNFIEFELPNERVIILEWVEDDQALYVEVTEPGTESSNTYVLLEGVTTETDALGNSIPPFTLEYELGRKLHRATIDMTVTPDDNQSVQIEGDYDDQIRLVGSAMPRIHAYNTE